MYTVKSQIVKAVGFFNLKNVDFGAAYWQPKPTEQYSSLKLVGPELKLEEAELERSSAGGSRALGTRQT